MSFPHRTYCDTLTEMRAVLVAMSPFNVEQSRAVLKTLIEECQTYGNRMEAGLHYSKDLEFLHNERKHLKKALKEDTDGS